MCKAPVRKQTPDTRKCTNDAFMAYGSKIEDINAIKAVYFVYIGQIVVVGTAFLKSHKNEQKLSWMLRTELFKRI